MNANERNLQWKAERDAKAREPAPKKKSKPKTLTADDLGAGAKSRKPPVEPTPSEPVD